MVEKGKRLPKNEHKSNHLKTRVALLVAVGLLGLLSACAPAIATSPTVAPTSSYLRETGTLVSVDKTALDLTDLKMTYKTTPIEIQTFNKNITAIGSIPLPCGPPLSLTIPDNSTQPSTTVLETDVRQQICTNLSRIADALNVHLSQEDIDRNASQIYAVPDNDIEKYCNSHNISACFLSGPNIIIIRPGSSLTDIIHEKGHAIKLSDNHYLSENTKTCYKLNSLGVVTIVYPDSNSPTKWSTMPIPNELGPSIWEQMLLAKIAIITPEGSYVMTPGYVGAGTHDKELINKFVEIGQNYYTSTDIDPSLVFYDNPVTMKEFYDLIEKLLNNQMTLQDLSQRFGQHLATIPKIPYEYIAPVPSPVDSTVACGE